jgi:hypothetical protein
MIKLRAEADFRKGTWDGEIDCEEESCCRCQH